MMNKQTNENKMKQKCLIIWKTNFTFLWQIKTIQFMVTVFTVKTVKMIKNLDC